MCFVVKGNLQFCSLPFRFTPRLNPSLRSPSAAFITQTETPIRLQSPVLSSTAAAQSVHCAATPPIAATARRVRGGRHGCCCCDGSIAAVRSDDDADDHHDADADDDDADAVEHCAAKLILIAQLSPVPARATTAIERAVLWSAPRHAAADDDDAAAAAIPLSVDAVAATLTTSATAG
jgi:hypothetical protein